MTVHAAALLLDMDGTLVDSHAVVERVWTQWSIAHGIDPARTLAIAHGRQGHETMGILLPDRTPEENLVENRTLLAAETADTEGIVAIDGALTLLTSLDGLPHALVTSATRELATARMGASGLGMPVSAVYAEDVRASKPDPEGFLAAAAALGVEPAECIVVEDSASGIRAGLAAGRRVIGVGPAAAAEEPTWALASVAGIHVTADPDGRGLLLELDGA
jgi:HAD superfamily hydrolase (TIGR01509 family)